MLEGNTTEWFEEMDSARRWTFVVVIELRGEVLTRRLAFGSLAARQAIMRAARDTGHPHPYAVAMPADPRQLDGFTVGSGMSGRSQFRLRCEHVPEHEEEVA